MNIASEIYLPELLTAEGAGAVNVTCGKVPYEVCNPIWCEENIQLSKNELLFSIKGVASYYVSNGTDIVVETDRNVEDSLVKLYLLGTAMGIILLQRGILPIHGSSVVIDGQCIIFTGISGAGKSTLSSAFRKMGCLFLSDDVSVITVDQLGNPWVQPGYPQQKLCRDSLMTIGGSTRSLGLINAEIEKYAVPVKKEFLDSPARLTAICELKPEERSSVQMTKLRGLEKLEVLIRNIYRIEFLKLIGMEPKYFKQCVNVAKNTVFFKMERPKGFFSLEEQVNLVRKSLKCLI